MKIEAILAGVLKFADTFAGELVTETMLIQGINDNRGEIEETADFLAELKPDRAYLAIPTRPPAQRGIRAANESVINMAYQVLSQRLSGVECLTGYEGNAFTLTGKVQDDLLSITSVHPMRQEAVMGLLKQAGKDWKVIEKLIRDNILIELEYGGRKFYMRKLQ